MNLFPVVLFLSCALCGMAAALGMAVCRLPSAASGAEYGERCPSDRGVYPGPAEGRH